VRGSCAFANPPYLLLEVVLAHVVDVSVAAEGSVVPLQPAAFFSILETSSSQRYAPSSPIRYFCDPPDLLFFPPTGELRSDVSVSASSPYFK